MTTGRRNVLFVVLDQWRADALGAAGNDRILTPNLDRLAHAGTIFRNHFAQATPCGPARAALLTGLYQHNNHVLRNGSPLENSMTNLAREARKVGYDPVLFGYTDSTPDPRERHPADPALASYEGVMPGFTPGLVLIEDSLPWLAYLEEKGLRFKNVAEALEPAEARGASSDARYEPRPARFESRLSRTNFLTDEVIRFLSVRRREQWFVHLSIIAPHPPFIAPAPFHALYCAEAMPERHAATDAASEARQHRLLAALLRRARRESFFAGDGPVATLSEADFSALRATYYGMVSEVDDAIGRLLGHLEEWGLAEETLVLVTADHGEMLGDHWLLGKEGYFAEATKVPLIIRMPGAAGGGKVDEFTEAVDVMPTILEWIGSQRPPRADGHALGPFCRGDRPRRWRNAVHWEGDFREPEQQSVATELGLTPDQCGFAVRRDGKFQYVHFAALPPLLFDLERDPGCFTNLADRPDYAVATRDAAQAMLSWRMATTSGPLSHLLATPQGMVHLNRKL